MHAWIPTLKWLRGKKIEFHPSLDYITRPCLKGKKNKQTEEIKTIFCGASELTQWEMAPATKPDDPSLNPRILLVGGEN